MKISIVIPTYNEAANMNELLRRLVAVVPAAQIIVVDDASPDGTSELIRSFVAPVPVKVIVRERERGLGGALTRGLREALADGAEFVVTIDADLSHAPEDIPRLLKAAEEADLVLGSRRVPGGSVVGWSRGRDLLSRTAAGISRFVFGLRTRDATTGFRVYRADFLKAIDLAAVRSKGYAFQEEMVMLAETGGFSVAEVPIEFVDRRPGGRNCRWLKPFSRSARSSNCVAAPQAAAHSHGSPFWRSRRWLFVIIFHRRKESDYDMGAFSYRAIMGRHFNFFRFYSSPLWMKLSFPNYALYFPILALSGTAHRRRPPSGARF